MTINGINSSSFANACVTPEAQIAVMVLRNEGQQQEINQQNLVEARHSFIEHSAREVGAMHEEADHIARGAWFEAGAVTAGAVFQGIAIGKEADCGLTNKPASQAWSGVRTLVASTSTGLSSAGGKLLGESPAANDRAEAKQFSTAAAQDQWELDDRKHAIQQSEAHQQQATDWLAKVVEKDDATATAMLSDLA